MIEVCVAEIAEAPSLIDNVAKDSLVTRVLDILPSTQF